MINGKNIRSPIARELLEYISKEYETLPFCSRWLVNKFGTKALFGLKQLEENGNLYQFKQLIESSRSKVAQAEHTLIIEKKEVFQGDEKLSSMVGLGDLNYRSSIFIG